MKHGCDGCNPRRYGSSYLVKCENDTYLLMAKLICFSALLYHYIDSSVFLEVARRGGYSPLAPLNLPLGYS